MTDTTVVLTEHMDRPASGLTEGIASVRVDGVTTHLPTAEDALAVIAAGARRRGPRPLAVASVNLDHIHHFGASRRRARGLGPAVPSGRVEWLGLIDGAPIARQVGRMTGRAHPKLSGSDLVGPILDDAERGGRRVGVLGGFAEVDAPLRAAVAAVWPDLDFAGHWMPPRGALGSPHACDELAEEVRHAEVDVLLVCLGKPRQEDWIDSYGDRTGAGALLAFGAVVDFLSGHDVRAPEWMSRSGVEWAWRLARDPGRLARRYLIDGPPAYAAVRRSRAA